MELTDREKKRIFYALLHDYSQFQASRAQAQVMFANKPEKLKESLEMINNNELADYKLICKFGKEIGQEIPDYVQVNVEALCEEAFEKFGETLEKLAD